MKMTKGMFITVCLCLCGLSGLLGYNVGSDRTQDGHRFDGRMTLSVDPVKGNVVYLVSKDGKRSFSQELGESFHWDANVSFDEIDTTLLQFLKEVGGTRRCR